MSINLKIFTCAFRQAKLEHPSIAVEKSSSPGIIRILMKTYVM